jgi:hypothetical protein
VHELTRLHWCTAGKQASKQHTIQLCNKHPLEVEEKQMPFCIFITEKCLRIFHKEVQHDITA